jgi:anti-sigma factor RsiW
MKRGIQAAGKRFAPSAEFRRKVQSSIATKPRRSFGLSWTFAAALPILAIVALLSTYVGVQRSRREQTYSEIADLHVASLANTARVDVVSSDRHTVKPWFEGRIPFTFDLPEVQNSEFSLLGGRMTYLDQTPGAQLIYAMKKHEISVFVFPESALRGRWSGNSAVTNGLTFNMTTWSQRGLRYFVIGDPGAADVNNLAKLFRRPGS